MKRHDMIILFVTDMSCGREWKLNGWLLIHLFFFEWAY